ncbi:hypothetical protein V6Z12_D10G058900 [Gossypium hirsutum]
MPRSLYTQFPPSITMHLVAKYQKIWFVRLKILIRGTLVIIAMEENRSLMGRLFRMMTSITLTGSRLEMMIEVKEQLIQKKQVKNKRNSSIIASMLLIFSFVFNEFSELAQYFPCFRRNERNEANAPKSDVGLDYPVNRASDICFTLSLYGLVLWGGIHGRIECLHCCSKLGNVGS